MELTELFNQTPFVEHLGIEVTRAEDGVAEARMPLAAELHSNNWGSVAHGGATYALADTVGGAAVISLAHDVTPTVDMRIDYLEPMTDDAKAEAEVTRLGQSTAVVDAVVLQDGREIALARGVYKAGEVESGTPHDWNAGEYER